MQRMILLAIALVVSTVVHAQEPIRIGMINVTSGQFADAGIDAVVCGPGDIAQAHAADEYIELDQIEACEQFVDALLTRLTR